MLWFLEKLCDVTHHMQFGSELTAFNEVSNCVVFILDNIYILILMVILYNVGDVECSYSVSFTYPFNIKEFIHYLILVLPYPVIFPYPIKVSVQKSAYFYESNNNQPHKSSCLNYF